MTKHRNFNHTQVNILNCTRDWWGVGFWLILFRRPITLRRSFQTVRGFQTIATHNWPKTRFVTNRRHYF